jgi:putative nucleotidyltransferase with HDIG domain
MEGQGWGRAFRPPVVRKGRRRGGPLEEGVRRAREAEVRAALRRFFDAYGAADLEGALACLVPPGEEALFVGSGAGEVRRGSGGFRAIFERDFRQAAELPSFRTELRDLWVRLSRSGDVAWALADLEDEYETLDGRRIRERGRKTLVLERRGGRWFQTHSHFSYPFPEQAPEDAYPGLRQAEERTRRRLNFEKLIASLSSRFVAPEDFDGAISASLEALGTFHGATSAYVFLFSPDLASRSLSHVWYAPSVASPPPRERFLALPSSEFRWFVDRLASEPWILIDDVAGMPPESGAERELIAAQGIGSLLVIPFRIAGRLGGYLGFDDVDRIHRWSPDDLDLLRIFAGVIGGAFEALEGRYRLEEQGRRLAGILDGVVGLLSGVVEKRDPYTAGHQRRAAALAEATALRLGYGEEGRGAVRLAALAHDVGKVSVPSEILSKPGGLSEIEYLLVKEHARIGAEILERVDFPWPVAEIVRQHHERLDGSGYPRGLAGEAILPEARIIAVADVVEAMSSHRPYRPGLGIEAALEEIRSGEGLRYDPDATGAVLALFSEGFEFPPASSL